MWVAPSVAFFAYVIMVAVFRPGVTLANRLRSAAGAASGVALALVGGVAPDGLFLKDWLLPAALLLAAYWSTGRLFVAPQPAVERVFQELDDSWRVEAIAARLPRVWVETLEVAYSAVYLLVPLALVAHLRYASEPDPARFWSVVLITDYVCFGMLPWIQTRPPRALSSAEPWVSSVRRYNLRLLGTTSVRVNTFPSGHAAEALAALLLVLSAPLPVVLAVGVTALAVSAGAVLGRYHYAIDAAAGWVVALLVWIWVGR